MDLHTYLKYNGIQLVDPTNDYHASCIKQFTKSGSLSPKQLDCLRRSKWCNASDIQRLLAMPINQPKATTPQSDLTPFDADFVPQVRTPSGPKTGRFTTMELAELVDTITSKGNIEDLAKSLNRSINTLRTTANNFGAVIRKGQVVAYDQNKFNTMCKKRNLSGGK